jgi:15-cis-phytoene synthase
MSYIFSWEDELNQLALGALEEGKSELSSHEDINRLKWAYRNCEEITKDASKTFFMASSLLPQKKKNSIRALYAFCRITDDIVDRSFGEGCELLTLWKEKVFSPNCDSVFENDKTEALVACAWDNARRRHKVPFLFVEQLLAGISNDLFKVRYKNFNELAAYCYGVACTVGLMSMRIVGHTDDKAVPYAVRLGVALQLTNILRDVHEDWQLGRLYLPQDEMDEFGISEEDIDRGIVTERWRSFMRFQIERARLLYASGLPGIRFLNPDGRFAIAAAAELYHAILTDIENHDYDVFTRRAHVSAAGKFKRLPGIWIRSRFTKYPAVAVTEIERKNYLAA